MGDNIKLRSDCLTQRHGQSDAPALAALIYNALTGRRFSSERDALQLPAPFATLVRAGAGSNASLAAMRRVLSAPAVTNAGSHEPLARSTRKRSGCAGDGPFRAAQCCPEDGRSQFSAQESRH